MRAFWTALSCAIGAMATWLLLPQTNWIPRVGWEWNERLWASGPHHESRPAVDETDDLLARVLFGVEPQDSRFERLALAAQVLDGQATTPLQSALVVQAAAEFVRFPSLKQPLKTAPGSDAAASRSDYAARLVSRLAGDAAALEPDNALWPLEQAFAWVSLGHEERALQSISRAAACRRYDDFTWKAVDFRGDWAAERAGYDSQLLRLSHATQASLSQASPVTLLGRRLLADRPLATTARLRWDLARIGWTLLREADTVTMRYRGMELTVQAVARPALGRRTMARYSLAELESAARSAGTSPGSTFEDALALAQRDVPSNEADDRTLSDAEYLLQGSTGMHFAGIVCWTIAMMTALMTLGFASWKKLGEFRAGLPAFAMATFVFAAMGSSERAGAVFFGAVVVLLCLFSVGLWATVCLAAKYRLALYAVWGAMVAVPLLAFVWQFTEFGIYSGLVSTLIGLAFAYSRFRVKEVWAKLFHPVLTTLLTLLLGYSSVTSLYSVRPDSLGLWVCTFLATAAGVVSITSRQWKTAVTSATVACILATVVLMASTLWAMWTERTAERALVSLRNEAKAFSPWQRNGLAPNVGTNDH